MRDDHSSGTRLAARLTRPTRTARRECLRTPCGRRPSLFGLAPGGVYPAAPVARGAVRSCRTVSPLPAGPGVARRPCAGGLFSVALSLGSPPPAVSRHRIPVEPGLSSIRARRAAAVRPSGAGEMRGSGGRVKRGDVIACDGQQATKASSTDGRSGFNGRPKRLQRMAEAASTGGRSEPTSRAVFVRPGAAGPRQAPSCPRTPRNTRPVACCWMALTLSQWSSVQHLLGSPPVFERCTFLERMNFRPRLRDR